VTALSADDINGSVLGVGTSRGSIRKKVGHGEKE
jgi:hypothetical protein